MTHQKGTRCGVGPMKRVACLQRFATLKWYTVVASTVTLVAAAAYAYYSSVQSTIQTVFSLSSADIGIWYAFFEIGSISANILVPYFLSSKSIPKVLTVGFLLGVISYFIQGLPQVYRIGAASILARSHDKGLEIVTIAQRFLSVLPSPFNYPDILWTKDVGLRAQSNTKHIQFAGEKDVESIDEKSIKSRIFLAILCVAGLINGVGYAPSYSLGMSYIDNNVKPGSSSSKYLATLLASWPLGPVIGFAVGAVLLEVHVTVGETSLKPDDAGWIGAWWVGYLVWGAAILILLPFLVLFPRRLKDSLVEVTEDVELKSVDEGLEESEHTGHSTEKINQSEADDDDNKIRSLKGFLPALKGLLMNPLYVLLVLSSCLASYHLAGWLSFIPKFFEEQFFISPSLASIYSGVIPAVVSCIVILVSGFTLSKFNLTLQQDCLVLMVSSLVGLLFFIPLFFISCQQFNTQTSTERSYACLTSCICDPNEYLPVCHDGVSYRSPCIIGCTNTTKVNDEIIYSNCFCDENVSVKGGVCKAECSGQYAYVVLNVVTLAVYAVAATSGVRVIFKSVKAEDKGLALGIQSSMNSLTAWIPAPVLYGQLIDSTCLVWEYPDGAPGNPDWKGYCKEYDNDAYRIRYLGTTVGFLAAAFILMVIAWRVSWLPRYKESSSEVKTDSY